VWQINLATRQLLDFRYNMHIILYHKTVTLTAKAVVTQQSLDMSDRQKQKAYTRVVHRDIRLYHLVKRKLRSD